MMRKKKRTLAAFVLWTVVLSLLPIKLPFLTPGSAHAASAAVAEPGRYGTPFADTSLSGMYSSAQHYFQVMDYWKVSGATLRLDYAVSQLTQGDTSSITLYINGKPFHSFRPATEEEAAGTKRHLTVDIPAAYLIKGVNTLTVEGTIQTMTTVSENGCVPLETRGSWLQLYKTSAVDVRYAAAPFTGTIADFNRHFVGLDTTSAGANAVVVPADGQPAELEAALYALSGFAKASSDKEIVIPLLEGGADGDSAAGKRAVVYVGLYDRLPTELRGRLNVGGEDLNAKALLQVVTDGAAPDRATLVITSTNAELLGRAGRLAANQALLGQIGDKQKWVDAATEVETPPVTISRNVTLSDAGDKLVGAMHREKSYFVSLPGNRSIAEASKLSFSFRYASNLDFDRSMVTILVGNTPIGSKRLTAERADGDSIDLTIPKNLGISGNFSVTAAFDLELKNAGCMQAQEQMPWAFIAKDSVLQLNTKDRADMLFNNYPYPFLRDGAFNRVALVLPKERDSYTYKTLANLFHLLGQYAVANTGEIRVYDDSVAAAELSDRQIIAVGSFKDNKIIRDNNEKLYFRYGAGGAGFRSNEKMSIDAGYGKRIGTLQLIDSPYEAGHGLLAVTGASSQYAYLASKLVATESKLFGIFGDGVATDTDGNVNSFRFKKEADPARPTVMAELIERGDVVAFLVAIMLVLLLVLVSLVLLIRKHRIKRRKSR